MISSDTSMIRYSDAAASGFLVTIAPKYGLGSVLPSMSLAIGAKLAYSGKSGVICGTGPQ